MTGASDYDYDFTIGFPDGSHTSHHTYQSQYGGYRGLWASSHRLTSTRRHGLNSAALGRQQRIGAEESTRPEAPKQPTTGAEWPSAALIPDLCRTPLPRQQAEQPASPPLRVPQPPARPRRQLPTGMVGTDRPQLPDRRRRTAEVATRSSSSQSIVQIWPSLHRDKPP